MSCYIQLYSIFISNCNVLFNLHLNELMAALGIHQATLLFFIK